jgi:hypothetical protein
MELNEKIQTEIADIFRKVTWGEITFKLSPENRTLDYSIKTTGKLAIGENADIYKPRPSEEKSQTLLDIS